MPDSARPRSGLEASVGNDTIDTIDNTLDAAFDLLDQSMALDDQGMLSARPPSSVLTPGVRGRYYRDEYGRLHRDNGTGWDTYHPTPLLVTTADELAALTPFDGQVVRVQTPAMAAKGIVWTFVYNAGSVSTYKWEFAGGAPWVEEAPGNGSLLATNGFSTLNANNVPAITLALEGQYDVELEVGYAYADTNGANVEAGPMWTGLTPGPADMSSEQIENAGVSKGRYLRRRRRPTIVAGGGVSAVYHVTLGQGTFARKSLSVVPVRVK